MVNEQFSFSRTYLSCIQRKIEAHIRDGELESALKLLDNLTPENDPRIEIDRLITQREGYRAIAQKVIGVIGEYEGRIEEVMARFPST